MRDINVRRRSAASSYSAEPVNNALPTLADLADSATFVCFAIPDVAPVFGFKVNVLSLLVLITPFFY